MRVALVDDEPLALDYLAGILENLPDVTVTYRYRNGREAIRGLQRSPVDLVFLDIQMPGLDGFDVVAGLQADTMPLVIFATAYDEFAVKAFEMNAVDYILKPFVAERVEEAVVRARMRLQSVDSQPQNDGAEGTSRKHEALKSLNTSRIDQADVAAPVRSTDMGRLAIKDGQHTQLIVIEDIDWVDAAGDYMCVHALGETHILRSTMKDLAGRLPDNFVRIHRSTIVNLRKIESVEGLPKGEAQLHMVGGAMLKVSRNFRKAIQNLLS